MNDQVMQVVSTVLMLVGVVVVFYFFMYRPQKSRKRRPLK